MAIAEFDGLIFCDVCRKFSSSTGASSIIRFCEAHENCEWHSMIAHIEQLSFFDYVDYMFEELWKYTTFGNKEYKDELKSKYRARFYRDAS